MTVNWTPHRFAGGNLALNVTNTVVLRDDPARSFDRFEDAAELPRFAAAASIHCAEELGGRRTVAADPAKAHRPVIELREAADRLFRRHVLHAGFDTADLAALLSACAGPLAAHREMLDPARPFGQPDGPIALETAVALSALSLLDGRRLERIKICRNCAWLFLDRSRNASRLWCDMAVCGNRQKARRHYRRHRPAKETSHV